MPRGTSELATVETVQSRSDRWAAWPALVILTAALLVAVLCGLPGVVSFILIPLMVLGTPLVGAGLIVMALVVAVRRRLRMAASIMIAVLLPVVLWKPIIWTAQCMHLALTVWTGAGQLGHVSRPKGSPFAAYDWSVGLAGGPATFLIYDVTDEIALPLNQHKQPISVELEYSKYCAGAVAHLLGHYYVCTF